jgi:hypothetical protein
LSGKIHEDQWLAELEKISRRSDPGRTSTEIGAVLGKTAAQVRVLLQRVRALGRLVRGERMIERIDGKPNRIPVYSILRTATVKSKGRKR